MFPDNSSFPPLQKISPCQIPYLFPWAFSWRTSQGRVGGIFQVGNCSGGNRLGAGVTSWQCCITFFWQQLLDLSVAYTDQLNSLRVSKVCTHSQLLYQNQVRHPLFEYTLRKWSDRVCLGMILANNTGSDHSLRWFQRGTALKRKVCTCIFFLQIHKNISNICFNWNVWGSGKSVGGFSATFEGHIRDTELEGYWQIEVFFPFLWMNR